ncbi:MAG: hypothetical protein LBJ59_03415 [Zoogloeaceae bacterium]|jgi:hypothetical protein|nr:hypothetical protein [Zoogloeaceae bacterium]
MPLLLNFGETTTDMELQARVHRNNQEELINVVQIISATDGYYVKIWLNGLPYYMSTRPGKGTNRATGAGCSDKSGH